MGKGRVYRWLRLAAGLLLLQAGALACSKGPAAEDYAKEGKELLQAKQYDQAIEKFTEAIKLKPDFTQAYNNRGVAYCDKGLYDLAIVDFTEAIKLDPNNGKAFNNRGVAHYLKGEQDQAQEDFKKAQSLGIQVRPELLSGKPLEEATTPSPGTPPGAPPGPPSSLAPGTPPGTSPGAQPGSPPGAPPAVKKPETKKK